MNDATRRALRTFVQVFSVQALIQLWNAFSPSHLTAEQATAITLVMTPIVGLVQNLLEDSGTIPALLKPPTVAADELQSPVDTDHHTRQ